jgi:predicted Ser/Thr protein kinase
MSTDGPAGARYEIIAELGRGGAGIVYLAHHRGLDRFVAIKRVTGAFALTADAHERLRQEAQVLGRLDHPNIVRVYDYARTGHDALIVMEYVDGDSLDALVARGELTAEAAVVVLADVATALAHAHAQGVVHRDVKPSNVLVTKEGRAKLADFGLARLLRASAHETPAETLIGTPAYMAPEQILGEDADARTDAYAFAAVAYELLTGREVFAHDDRRALLDAHLLAQPVSPTALVEGFPVPASDAIMRGLAKRPDDRPPVAALARVLVEIPSDAWPRVAAPRRPPAARPAMARTEGNIAPDDVVVVRHDSSGHIVGEHIDVPVYVPPPTIRPKGRGVRSIIAMIMVVAIAAALGVVLISRRHGAGLVVRAIRVDVTPNTGGCPRAVYTFTASIVGNGDAGSVRFRWIRPDGERTAIQSVRVPGSEPARADLRFTVAGTTPTAVVASLELLSPMKEVVRSPRAKYTCA